MLRGCHDELYETVKKEPPLIGSPLTQKPR